MTNFKLVKQTWGNKGVVLLPHNFFVLFSGILFTTRNKKKCERKENYSFLSFIPFWLLRYFLKDLVCSKLYWGERGKPHQPIISQSFPLYSSGEIFLNWTEETFEKERERCDY